MGEAAEDRSLILKLYDCALDKRSLLTVQFPNCNFGGSRTCPWQPWPSPGQSKTSVLICLWTGVPRWKISHGTPNALLEILGHLVVVVV